MGTLIDWNGRCEVDSKREIKLRIRLVILEYNNNNGQVQSKYKERIIKCYDNERI